MITLLRGRLVQQGPDHAVLDVQGVGYLVTASARSLRQLPPMGESAELLIDLQISDEAIRLYGFIDEAERLCFRLLQTVQGVGARAALSLLGTLGPDGVRLAVAAGDRAALTRAPGIGARLAARITVELKERLDDLPAAGLAHGTSISVAGAPAAGEEDALQALARLGFSRSEAHQALVRVRERLGAEPALDLLIREGLRELSRPELAR